MIAVTSPPRNVRTVAASTNYNQEYPSPYVGRKSYSHVIYPQVDNISKFQKCKMKLRRWLQMAPYTVENLDESSTVPGLCRALDD